MEISLTLLIFTAQIADMTFQKGVSFLVPLKNLLSDSRPLSMVWIESGTFMMGSSGNRREYRHGYERPFKGDN